MKKLVSIFLCIATLFTTTITAYANDIQLYSNNVNSTITSFVIDDNGKATVNIEYLGKSGVTSSAKIVTKVQKKVGLIWVTVSGGSWTDTITATNYSKSHSVKLSSKTTYRAHIEFIISGTGGSDDKITKNIEKTYDGVISVQPIDQNGNLCFMSNTSDLTIVSFPGAEINVLDFKNGKRIINQCSGSSVATALASGYFSLFISNCKSKDIDLTYDDFNEHLKCSINKDKILDYNKFVETSNIGD